MFQEEVFKHHRPITAEDIQSKQLGGLDGAYTDLIGDLGYNTDDPTIGVIVQTDKEGEVEGARLAKCGKVKPKESNTTDFWPEAGEGRLVIEEFDLSKLGDQNSYMTSMWTDLPIKIMVKKGSVWKSVKKAEYEERGYSSLVFRAHFIPVGVDKAKFIITAVPGEAATIHSTYGADAGRRGYPGIKVHEAHCKIVISEEPEHRWGLGVQPFVLVKDASVDERGAVITEDISYPSSMDIKFAVVGLLSSATVPNWHHGRAGWEKAINSRKFSSRVPQEVWPAPRVEDAVETEVEDSSEGEGEEV